MTEKYHMAGLKSKLHIGWRSFLTSMLLLLAGISVTCAATITYTYDNLHRLTTVNYGNGVVIDYSDLHPPGGSLPGIRPCTVRQFRYAPLRPEIAPRCR